jgi:23S rRNA-/tRNA-specific pseudouridylate synthase
LSNCGLQIFLSLQASAFIRKEVSSVKDVRHLKGGIHKYLETYGGDGHWKGRNFVFDGRGAASAEETRLGRDGKGGSSSVPVDSGSNDILGTCVSCSRSYDEFDPSCVCTVCREPTLVCPCCRAELAEYHCHQHAHLRECYFSNLEPFSSEQLLGQLHDLDAYLSEIAVGRKFKQKRKTLQKQRQKVVQRLDMIQAGGGKDTALAHVTKCRNCGETECTGRCWGFYGLKRKKLLQTRSADNGQKSHDVMTMCTGSSTQRLNVPFSKNLKRDRLVEEIKTLDLSAPPCMYRNQASGVRVPACTTRVLRCNSKAKWCGRAVLNVLKEEFVELSKPENIQKFLERGLLRVNGQPLKPSTASHVLLKSSDEISRITHWHEAPIIVPETIGVSSVLLPVPIIEEFGIQSSDEIYICDKPASVPVHPAGPYLSNSLTMMVEAQEQLEPYTLIPLHRTDRVTSGLTLCCTGPSVSRVFHRSIMQGHVQKLYLAKVHGRFVSSPEDVEALPNLETGTFTWRGDRVVVEVDAPVETIDPANGIRAVTKTGKPSKSLFRFESYDSITDTSLISCYPVTGRNHQLRVHLQLLGFPIVGDVQYSGKLLSEHTEVTEVGGLVLEMMAKASVKEPSDSATQLGLSQEDVDAAKQVCACCEGGIAGIIKSFTPAQLLRGGHAICLHALRYRAKIFPRKKTISPYPLATMNFEVGLPKWAAGKVDGELSWLEF